MCSFSLVHSDSCPKSEGDLMETLSKSKPMKRRLLSDDVVEYLIDEILGGGLKPGDRVVELRLAKSMGVSQSTVREAMRELEVRGYLYSLPFKGTFVREFNLEGLADYFRTRTELEMIAAGWAREQEYAGVDWEVMKTCLEEMAKATASGDHITLRKADMRFHRAIVEGAGSQSLLAAWNALSHRFWGYYGMHMEQKIARFQIQESLHREIFTLYRQGRLDEFRQQLLDHYIDMNTAQKLDHRTKADSGEEMK